jgi:hypothetical protein
VGVRDGLSRKCVEGIYIRSISLLLCGWIGVRVGDSGECEVVVSDAIAITVKTDDII